MANRRGAALDSDSDGPIRTTAGMPRSGVRAERSADPADRLQPSLLVIGRSDSAQAGTCEYLAMHGFRVEVAGDGAGGLGRAFRGEFDLIVLVTSAPDVDGAEVLRQLRQRSAIPVIVLAERGEAAQRIDAFDAGADDYLERPFAPKELRARLRAVLRRVRVEPASWAAPLRVGHVTLDPRTRTVGCRGRWARLSMTEGELLAILMRAAGRVVSRDEFATALYQRKLAGYERSVDIRISQLRRKLAHAGAPQVIRTVRGIGYLFVLEEAAPF